MLSLVDRFEPSVLVVLPPFWLPLVELLFWLLASEVDVLPPFWLPLLELSVLVVLRPVVLSVFVVLPPFRLPLVELLFWLLASDVEVLPPFRLSLVELFGVFPELEMSPTARLPLLADDVPAPRPLVVDVELLLEFWSPTALLPLLAAEVPAPRPLLLVLELVGVVCAVAAVASRAATDVVTRYVTLMLRFLKLALVGPTCESREPIVRWTSP